jgi:MFS family permease
MAFILQGAIEEWKISSLIAGLFGALLQLGLLLGSLFWGYFSDSYGRIPVFRLSVSLSLASGVLLLCSFHTYMAAISLFLLGFCLSAEASLAGTVLFEYCPPSKRYYMSTLTLFFSLGSALSALAALIVHLVNSTSLYDWRLIVLFACSIEIVLLILRIFLRETPAYLCHKENFKQAEETLDKISLKNGGKGFNIGKYEMNKNGKNRINESDELVGTIREKMSALMVLKTLFNKEYRRPTLTFGFVCVI